MKTGTQLISEERDRQIAEEGHTTDRDVSDHPGGELALAAIHYASPEGIRVMIELKESLLENGFIPAHVSAALEDMPINDDMVAFLRVWPWNNQWDKKEKHYRVRQLAIAGALIAAEIDRLIVKGGKDENEA